MFTGLVEEVGSVVSAEVRENGTRLQIASPRTGPQTKTGESIALNGCCLTLALRRGDKLTFDLLQETIARTNLKNLRPNSRVNLERALRVDSRLGGHLVQGHVDCVSAIISFGRKGADFRLEVGLPSEFARYVVSKGSIAVNGISLTIAELHPKSFVTCIIPYTQRHTNLDRAKSGDLVNLEFDIVAKYVEKMIAPFGINK
jgi:riboflavin synthase